MSLSPSDLLRLKLAEHAEKTKQSSQIFKADEGAGTSAVEAEDAPPSASDPWSGPMPPMDTVSLLRATLWDNGPEPKTTKNGNTGKRTRFGLTIEIYQQPVEKLARIALASTFTWKKNVQLRPMKTFMALVARNRKTGRISREFHDLLTEYATLCDDPSDLLGFVVDNRSWTYHQGQFIHVFWNGDTPIINVIQSPEATMLDDWEITEKPKAGIDAKYTAEIDFKGYRDARSAYLERTKSQN